MAPFFSNNLTLKNQVSKWSNPQSFVKALLRLVAGSQPVDEVHEKGKAPATEVFETAADLESLSRRWKSSRKNHAQFRQVGSALGSRFRVFIPLRPEYPTRVTPCLRFDGQRYFRSELKSFAY